MVYRVTTLLVLVISISLVIGCGGDSPTGPEPEPEPDPQQGVISGTVTATDGRGGIEDALLELVKNESISQEIYTDTEGKFSFGSVESGQYKVELTLPQGYRESGSTSETVQVDNDVSVEFEGEPIQDKTVTIKAGNKDTVATASGAFVAVDASSASSDMEITISEIENESDEENSSKPVKIHIRPSGASKSSVSPAKRMLNTTSTTAASVNVSLGQKVKNTGPASLVFSVESEDGILPFYADPEQETLVDPNTKRESTYYTHSISTTPTTDSEFSLYYKRFDNSCDNKNRNLKPVPSDKKGQISLILVHGLQPTLGLCDDFNTYDPLNNTFDKLVTRLLANSEINDKYRLYTYKYPTNAPIQEASDELWNQIEGNDQIQKPVIIAHSMGGLVVRKMVATEGDETVRGLITLGTMHNGTPIANTAGWISNAIAAYCLSPTNLFNAICLVDNFNGGILPNTPGLRDLRKENVEKNFDPSDVKKDKIFTLGGDLETLDNISSHNTITAKETYRAGYSIMKILGESNDGLVPTSSAKPDWTSYQAVLEGHDHSEMVDGNDLNSNSVFEHIQIILSLLSQDGSTEDPSLSYSPSSFEFPAEASQKTLSISNTGSGTLEWEVSSNTNWLSFDPASGTGDTDVTLKAEENTTGSQRNAEIQITSNGGDSEPISVTQAKVESSPTINSIDATPNPSNPGKTVNFSADISGDEPIDCEWDFGNGATSTECNTTYAYQSTGTFDVSLKAINGGGSDTATLTHEVVQSGKANVIYVDADATGNNDGTSWGNAFNSLQDGLAKAEAGKEIWVAEGTYYPDEGNNQTNNDRTATFQLKNEANMYGGFDGSEAARKNRDWENNVTTLSGNIDQVDDISENSIHVVTGSGAGSNTIIDGFIITEGNADSYQDGSDYGGGMYNVQGSPLIKNIIFEKNHAYDRGAGMYNNDSNPKITNVIFRNNYTPYGLGSDADGAGMYNRDSNPTIESCEFKNNIADGDGGAIFNRENSHPLISNTIISGNKAAEGGGMVNANNSNPLIKNVHFIANISKDEGGGLVNHESSPMVINVRFIDNSAEDDGGAIYNDDSEPQIVNTLFTGNSATDGGGIYNTDKNKILILNSTFSENSASDDGGGIYDNSHSESSLKFINTIMWGNTSSDDGNQFYNSSNGKVYFSHSIIQDGIQDDENIVNEGDNLTSNPLFIDADGPDDIPGTLDDNLHLQSGSPAINAGINDALDLDGDGDTTDDVPVDLDGNTRIQNGTVDIGAYETDRN